MSRKILVTGASSEIGAAICRKILIPGDEAVLHYSGRAKACEELAASLPCPAVCVKADFSSGTELKALCDEATKVDILVNCAAAIPAGLLLSLEDEVIDRAIHVNVTALTRLCRAALSGMLYKRKGVIVNVSSFVARRGNRGQSVYAGTKGYMEAFSRALAAEYGSRNIRVNCVAPGAIGAGSFKAVLVDAEKEIKSSVALKRVGTPEDVACAVEFLCSEKAAYVTGAVLNVDGGLMLGLG